jgi:prepilin-type N-terminal cleavage/methylation domain-containing protein
MFFLLIKKGKEMINKVKNATKKGFSLVELLVVVAIIGVLAGVGIVAYNGYIDSAKDTVNEANAGQLARKIIAEKSKPVDFKGDDLYTSTPPCAGTTTMTTTQAKDATVLSNATACFAKRSGIANLEAAITNSPDIGNLSVGTDGKIYWKEIATGNAIKSK